MRHRTAPWIGLTASAAVLVASWAVPATAGGRTRHVRAPQTVTVTLRVHVLKTTFGISGEKVHYPAYAEVRAETRWARSIAAYGVADTVLVAPAGWTGSGAVGADGSGTATLRATVRAAVAGRLTYEQSSACDGCAWYDAAPYFAWVRANWRRSGYTDLPGARRGLREDYLSSSLIAYAAPPDADGLEVNGVAYTTLIGHSAPAGDPGFQMAQIALPAGLHGLATVILNDFIARHVVPGGGIEG